MGWRHGKGSNHLISVKTMTMILKSESIHSQPRPTGVLNLRYSASSPRLVPPSCPHADLQEDVPVIHGAEHLGAVPR